MNSETCNVLLIVPRFPKESFWNCHETCAVLGARYPTAPLGLLTVAALLPRAWNFRLIDRNMAELSDADFDWADVVMSGGMITQRFDCLDVIADVHRHGKPIVVGGPDVSGSPSIYADADFVVVGEAESVIADFVAAWRGGRRRGYFEAEKFKADVTATPPPRFDLIERSNYMYYGVQFSRGCPFTCEFCDIIELYGRAPRVKTTTQMLAELDALYSIGYRGHLDFVDDNFIGNKKAVKAFLPSLIAWQKEHNYPFEFSTEASINLADDDELLALMRAANFFMVFVGIESPDAETLVAMKKKQNTRRDLAESIEKIYRTGLFVMAGFIVGFDDERGSVAAPMIECIEAAAIPICLVGLLYALPNTQLSRRLEKEERLFPATSMEEARDEGSGDQCTAGLNFTTLRERREVLTDYKRVIEHVYDPAAFFGRVDRVARTLDRYFPPRTAVPGERRIAGIPLGDFRVLGRLLVSAMAHPRWFFYVARSLCRCATTNPGSLTAVAIFAALYLHMGAFAKFVVRAIDRKIERETPVGSSREAAARFAPAPAIRDEQHAA